jgi:hypothetical protein
MVPTRRLFPVFAIVILFLITSLMAVAAPRAAALQKPEMKTFIVKMKRGLTQAQQRGAVIGRGGAPKGSISKLDLQVIEVPAVAADAIKKALQDDASVVRVDENHQRRFQSTPSDALYTEQWALPKIGWEDVYGSVTPVAMTNVAILDTGVDATHPDLDGNVLAGTSIIGGSATQDANGHGTWLAGIVAARTNNLQGIAGVGFDKVKIMPVKVLNDDGIGDDTDIIQGVIWAADNGASVILMAFSNPGFSASLQEAIDYAWSKNVVLIAAAGNDGTSEPAFPAGDRGVIGVSATDQSDNLATGSNYGQGVFLAAPGVSISGSYKDAGYVMWSGTSASAAIVAGSAALLRAVDPNLSNGVVVNRLAMTADPAGTQQQTGNGRVNIARAISQTSTDSIQPEGAAPLGEGGPFVGPYRTAAKGLDITVTGTGTGTVTVSTTDNTTISLSSCPTGSLSNGNKTATFTATCGLQMDNSAVGTIGTAANGGAAVAWSAMSTGISCTGGSCTFSMGNQVRSATVTFSGVSTTTAIARITGSNPSTYGDSITFRATVTRDSGSNTPTGTVQIKDGATVVCTTGSLSGSVSAPTATCSVSSLSVSGSPHSMTAVYAGDANFAGSTSSALSHSVTAKTVTGSFTAQSRPYDGTTTATILTRTITPADIVGSDNVTLTGGTAAFDNKNTGTGKTVTGTGFALGGTSAGNYQLGTVATTTANITGRAITVTAVTSSRVYDGTTGSSATPTITAGSLAGGDTATWTQTFDTRHVGTGKTLTPAGTVSDGNGGANYSVTFVPLTSGTITSRPITVTATAATKVYDGATSSSSGPTVTAGSLASGDTAGFTQAFDNRNAGTGKTLTPAGSVNDGNGGNNYAVTFVAVNTGTITARPITVTAASDSKGYDGSTSSAAAPTITSGSLAPAGGDTATFTQSFDNRNAGTGKTLTPAGSVNDGNGGNNYSVTFVAVNTGTITARPITVTATTDSKEYDGNASSPGVPTITTGALAAGDSATWSQTFDNKNAATGKTLTPAGQ